jgi:hypothetical protein
MSVLHLQDHFSNSGDPQPHGVTFIIAWRRAIMRLFLRKKGRSVTEPMRERLCVDLDGLIQRDIHWGTSCRTIVTHSDGDHARQSGIREETLPGTLPISNLMTCDAAIYCTQVDPDAIMVCWPAPWFSFTCPAAWTLKHNLRIG